MTPEQQAAWKFCEDLAQRALVAKQTSDTALDYYLKTFGTIEQGKTVALIDSPLQGLFTVTSGCPAHNGEIFYLIDNYEKNTQYIKPPEDLEVIK
jgi:hypothetical protein